MTDNWYKYSAEELCRILMTDEQSGLTRRFAAKKYKKFGPNVIYPVSRLSFSSYLKHVATDFTTLLMVTVALISAIFEHNIAGYVMTGLVICSLGFSIFTYARAQKILESLEGYTLPVVKCVRDGKLFVIAQKRLVPGDLILLSEGDVVPADARLIEAENFCCRENILFGFETPVRKSVSFFGSETAGLDESEQKNMVFADSIVTSGQARAIVCETGRNTAVWRKRKNRSLVSHEKLPILRVLKNHSKFWSVAMLGAFFVCVLLSLLIVGNNDSFSDIFMRGLSLSVASMSELFLAFGYIVIACGIFNAVKQYSDINSGAIIKNIASIDKLSRLSCIVVPKDAMFGSSNLSVDYVFVPGCGEVDIRSERNGQVDRLITYAIVSTGHYGEKEIKKKALFKNPDQEAIIAAGKRLSLYNIVLDRVYEQIDHRAYSQGSLFDTTLVRVEGEYVAVSGGSPDAILTQCVSYIENGTERRMTEQERINFRLCALSFSKRSLKVVAIASKKHAYNNISAVSRAQCELCFEGFLTMSSPLSLSVAQTVKNCKDTGIKTVMLCDDVNDSNVFFAQNIGVIEDEGQCITGVELSKMSPDLACTNASLYRVYSSLTPKQQKQLTLDLKKNGESVGVLGSSLADIETLEQADVAFAQNITISNRSGGVISFNDDGMSAVARSSATASKNGCEALKLSGDVILSDTDKHGNGGYNALVGAICSAKKIYLNICAMMKYLLAAQSMRFVLVFYSVIRGLQEPTALQVLFGGLAVDLVGVMIIAFEKQTQQVLRVRTRIERHLAHPFSSNIDALLLGIGAAAVLITAVSIAPVCGISGENLGTLLFFAMMLAQSIMLYQLKKDRAWFGRHGSANNVMLLFVMTLILFGVALVIIPPLGAVFGIGAFELSMLLILAGVGVASFLLVELYRFTVGRFIK